MTREEARKKAEIMLAYAEGKKIEFKKRESEKDWSICEPTFDWYTTDYRILSEPTYRPFKDAEECWQEMLKHEPFGWVYFKITHELNNAFIQMRHISNKGFRLYADSTDRKFESAFDTDSIYFADGTPFGIKEEEES